MKKVPFVTLDKLQEITAQFPTPFHLYDEKGIRENAKAVKEAFAWNKGFKEFFAVKATPNPFILNILKRSINLAARFILLLTLYRVWMVNYPF